MARASEALISMTEFAYDYGASDDTWLGQLLEEGREMFDHGLGVGAIVGTKSAAPLPQGQTDEIHGVQVVGGSPEFLVRHGQFCATLDPAWLHRKTRTGLWHLRGDLVELPGAAERWSESVGAEDGIGFIALDADGRGIHLLALSPLRIDPRGSERRQFQMLAAHVSAGLRLRKALEVWSSEDRSAREALPLGAEAIVNPTDFGVAEWAHEAVDRNSIRSLREAAIRVDRARGPLRKSDPDEALETWRALVRGRWSMVDWFDTDQRRYVLALPNPPNVPNPRGLTKTETQVVAYAALGEGHKMIAYRLGLARSTVTNNLRSAMRKLGVKTQAELVERLRAVPQTENTSDG